MIHSVKISGYRGFRQFEMEQLGAVNLLVGKNNSGKSSVLEAMYLLASGTNLSALWTIQSRRGERLELDPMGRGPPDPEVDISHLFYGHELRNTNCFEISTQNGRPDRYIKYELFEPSEQDEPNLPELNIEDNFASRLSLRISGRPIPTPVVFTLSRNGGLQYEKIDVAIRRRKSPDIRPAQYISTESLSARELGRLWNDIVLTETEGLVIKALQFLDPQIERIAAVNQSEYYYGSLRGGFKIKFKGVSQPVPIGSLGDGVWRMLALTISLIKAKGGVLLIDEIDTGLHYSIMSDLWGLIQNTAKENHVQVFATTHSYDCVQSFATICHPRRNSDSKVSIQRIEARKKRSIPFTESEIKLAADKRIEIR